MEKKNCPCKGFWRALIIIAAVIGAFVAAEAILERVFKKYLKITVELEDIDDLDDECDCCCEDDDCCCDEYDECCCEDECDCESEEEAEECCCCEEEASEEEADAE